jgi:hypothetical protein
MISSALSILRSSSRGSTVMVTVFARVVGFSDGIEGYLVCPNTYLLDSGRSFMVISLVRSIRLRSVVIGACWEFLPSNFSCSAATSVCNCRTVVTIFVVLVV